MAIPNINQPQLWTGMIMTQKDNNNNKLTIRNSTAEFLIFTQQAGENGIEVRYEEGSIWLTQKLMAELFDVTTSAINQHLKNIFELRNLIKIQLLGNS